MERGDHEALLGGRVVGGGEPGLDSDEQASISWARSKGGAVDIHGGTTQIISNM
jgi:hypothetical protein